MKKVCHMTSVHPKEDVRIFHKECVSLAKAGYEVYLVQQGESGEKNGVHILGFGEIARSRIRRMLVTTRSAYQKALSADADIYHLHDPELLPYAVKLKKRGKTVVYDSHEDAPADIMEKHWIPAPLRRLISAAYQRYERNCLSRLDGVISVTPHICDRLCMENPNVEMICNFPILEHDLPRPSFANRKVVFPGLISRLWCIEKIIKAIEPMENVTLELRSGNEEHPYFEMLQELPGWEKVHYPGKVSHDEVLALIAQCTCGMALVQYCPNTGWKTGTLGNTKIFEYMMVGIPMVCTDFVLWQEIVHQYHCGICVSPEDVDGIAAAIEYLLSHPEQARQMGENGRRAVEEAYNWGIEEGKLLAFYQKIAN